jgi:hypothetical protein
MTLAVSDGEQLTPGRVSQAVGRAQLGLGLFPMEVATRTGRSEGSVHGLHYCGGEPLKAELAGRGAALATAALRCLQAEADPPRVGAHQTMPR